MQQGGYLMNNVKTYIKSILVPVILGGIVGFITMQFMDYQTLEKPLLAPPSIVFPIVWTIIYILMGISYAMLKTKNINIVDSKIKNIYYVQLFVNLSWPILFFVFKARLFAYFWLIFLTILVAIMIERFYKKDKIAGLLQIPYLLWLFFASYLNLSIYLLN